jgi:NADH-quinone oxidoreductase subunit L
VDLGIDFGERLGIAHLLLLAPVPALVGFGLLALAPIDLRRRRVLVLGAAAGLLPAAVVAPILGLCAAGQCTLPEVAPIMTLQFGEAMVALAFRLDALSLAAGATVVTVGGLVLLYSVWYMNREPTLDLRRFAALMNLFIAGMLTVVFAGDSVVMFLGWEIIGLCSFFLIGYYTEKPRALVGARKAFIMTRIADAALLAGLLLLFLEAGSVRFEELIPAGAAMEAERRAIVASLLLVGALGKSAQLPLQTWLPTAMVGPTPVSALLHSATMVAAGAFLLARLSPVFAAAEGVSAATAVLGLATAAFGAFCALAQTDVKRLLAYSSMSQIGFMVLAVGVGAPGAAMAHFVVHAAFKSVLFLSAGAISRRSGGSTAVHALHGAATHSPLAFLALAAGAVSLAGVPLVTAGWYSKETILAAAWESGTSGRVLWCLGLAAAVLTAAYATRLVLAAAEPAGEAPRAVPPPGPALRVPLLVLSALAILGGFLVGPIVHALDGHHAEGGFLLLVLGGLAPLAGIWLALRLSRDDTWLQTPLMRDARRGFRFDARYYLLVVKPFRRIKHRIGREGAIAEAPAREGSGRDAARYADPVGSATVGLAVWLARMLTRALQPDRIDAAGNLGARAVGAAAVFVRRLQTGRLRDYALALAAGVAILLLIGQVSPWS